MYNFNLFATPWPVNLLILIPVIMFFWLRENKLFLSKQTLITTAIFGIAFGFVEASVVVYLRAALGFLPGFMTSLSEAASQSFNIYQQDEILNNLPKSLFTVEIYRETATMIMLLAVALLSGKKPKERLAVFLWIFAAWDIFYYIGLWLTVRWPYSLLTNDLLFLIPIPWYSQVWFPLLISASTMFIIATNRTRSQV